MSFPQNIFTFGSNSSKISAHAITAMLIVSDISAKTYILETRPVSDQYRHVKYQDGLQGTFFFFQKNTWVALVRKSTNSKICV